MKKLGCSQNDDGFKNLMIYVVYQALLDLKSKNKKRKKEAIEFLISEDCILYCEVVDIDYNVIAKVIKMESIVE